MNTKRLRVERFTSLVSHLGIALIFLVIFGLASTRKLLGGGVPEWFISMFQETLLASFPGLTLSFYSIALFETTLALLYLLSLVTGEFLPSRNKLFLRCGLTLNLLLFTQLLFGKALIQDHAGQFELFLYFGITLLCLHFVNSQAARERS